ncbi:MAG TPA: hypothetical protein VJB87_04460 [Candidatus Nanoarchaeia archaeon]|nr:hypothetical protein [Candidatus Nanoarchaeia archaeon]
MTPQLLGTHRLARHDAHFLYHALQTLPAITTYRTFIRFEHTIRRKHQEPPRPQGRLTEAAVQTYHEQIQAYERTLREQGFTQHLAYLHYHHEGPHFTPAFNGTEHLTALATWFEALEDFGT